MWAEAEGKVLDQRQLEFFVAPTSLAQPAVSAAADVGNAVA